MQDHARKLLSMLVGKGKTSVAELGLGERELDEAIADLSNIVDDDNHRVDVVTAYRSAGKLTAVELTEHGRGLARHHAG
jgi:hypothetical protein